MWIPYLLLIYNLLTLHDGKVTWENAGKNENTERGSNALV